MTKFDKKLCEAMAADMKAVLTAVAKKYNVELVMGNGSFNAFEYNKKLSFKVIEKGVTGEKVDLAAKKAFELNAPFAGLKASDFGKTFTSNGSEFRITGWNSKKYKYPVMAVEVATGKNYKFPAETVARKELK